MAAFPSTEDATPVRPPGTGPARRSMQWSQGAYPPVTTNAPTQALTYRTWWTVGGRLGLLTNALTPLVVLLALRQVPFALLSLRIFGANAFDRLAGLHAYAGHLLWVVATAHTATWFIQTGKDTYRNKRVVTFALLWTRFRWAVVSYVFLTLLVVLSFEPIRRRWYELFYVSHVGCIVGFLIAGALHHPPLAPWLWAALAWWLAERALRAFKVIHVNAILFNRPYYTKLTNEQEEHEFKVPPTQHESYAMIPVLPPRAADTTMSTTTMSTTTLTMGSSYNLKDDGSTTLASSPTMHKSTLASSPPMRALQIPESNPLPLRSPTHVRKDKEYDQIDDLISAYNGPQSPGGGGVTKGPSPTREQLERGQTHFPFPPTAATSPENSPKWVDLSLEDPGPTPMSIPPRPRPRGADPSRIVPIPPHIAHELQPGWAYAQALPGQTVRLTVRVARPVPWYPGQWINLNVPSVARFQSHPFTIATAVESAAWAPHSRSTGPAPPQSELAYQDGLTMVLLIRARQGFTRQLYKYVSHSVPQRPLSSASIGTAVPPTIGGPNGMHLRALIDGPYGSSPRIDWGAHHTTVVICAGSGVAYGIAALQYLCAGLLRSVTAPQAAQWAGANSGVPGFRAMTALLDVPALPFGAAHAAEWKTTRIHFVWIMRDLAHLLWAATPLRRCIEALPPNVLKVDLFVTGLPKPRAAKTIHQPIGAGYDLVAAESSTNELTSPMYSSAALNPTSTSPANELGYLPSPLRSGNPSTSTNDLGSLPTSGSTGSLGRMTPTVGTEALGLTDFDGEDAKPDKTDQNLNQVLARERTLRRERTRKTIKRTRGRTRIKDHLSTTQTPRSLSAFSGSDLALPPAPVCASHALPPPRPESPWQHAREGQRALYEGWGSAQPGASGTHTLGRSSPSPAPSFPLASQLGMSIDSEEQRDAQVLAELVQPGRPNLDKVVQGAQQGSTGPTLVTACGPPVLARSVRIAASRAADPARVAKGDTRGVVDIQVESFDWGAG